MFEVRGWRFVRTYDLRFVLVTVSHLDVVVVADVCLAVGWVVEDQDVQAASLYDCFLDKSIALTWACEVGDGCVGHCVLMRVQPLRLCCVGCGR